MAKAGVRPAGQHQNQLATGGHINWPGVFEAQPPRCLLLSYSGGGRGVKSSADEDRGYFKQPMEGP